MSRQFRLDDTSAWLHKYGGGQAGASILSGTYGAGNGGWLGACTGTSGSTSLTTPSGWGNIYDGWNCIIHQSRGTGAGNWELNKIKSISGTTSTMVYTLQNTYVSGAQCVLMYPYTDIAISGTLTSPAWDGSTGGIVALLATGTTNISGAIVASSLGFRGGVAADGITAGNYQMQGEGTGGAGGLSFAANGNGGGGCIREFGVQVWTSPGGGGNGATGGAGVPHNGSSAVAGGTNGGSNAGLTTMVFGGGGGAASNGDANKANGAAGGGIVFIISRFFTLSGSITSNGGSTGVELAGGSMTAGAGAGGSVLIKAMTATLGTNKISCSAGDSGTSFYSTPGGDGSVGRIHLDYLASYSGSTSPTIDVRQDPILNPSSAPSIFFS